MAKVARLKNLLWKWRGIAIAAPSISVVVIALRLLGALEPLELSLLDQFFRWRSPEPEDQRVVVVGIDEADIRQYGWPIDDALLTQLLDKVRQQKPRAIGLDLARDKPLGLGYAQLEKLFKTTPNLIGASKTADLVASNFAIASSDIAPPPALAELDQVGAINLPVDADGRVRRGLLSLRLPDGKTSLSFGLQLSLLYLEQEKTVPFEQALNPPRLNANDGGYSHIDVGGHQFIINYRRSAKGFQFVRMAEVLEGKLAPEVLRDRVVIIGVTAVSLRDWFFTPLDSGIGSTRIFTSGAEVHAQIVSHILSSSLDGRATIHTWEKYWEYLWIFGWALAGSFLIWQWRNVSSKDRELLVLVARSLSIFAIGGGLVAVSYIALNYGWWLPFVPAMIAFLGGGAIVTSYLAITAAQVRAYFSRYLTDAVVKSLLETPEGLKLGGDRRKVSILMCDLRGFSTVSEKMPPEKVVEILNVFLGTMTEAIAPYQGTIDEFIGDAILVLFGAPINREDDAARAVASAIAMQLAMRSVNEKLAHMNLPEIAMGIGINTGEVVAGNIGSQSRAKYAVVGNHVNLTARIESYTVGGQILISETTYQEVQDMVKTNGSMQVEPKGVSQPISIYDIWGIEGSYGLELPSINESLQVLPTPIPITYRILEEKHLGTDIFTGEIRRLSLYGAEIFASQDIPVLSNLKIHLQVPVDYPRVDGNQNSEIAVSGEIYAKVLKRQQPNRTSGLEQMISENFVLENKLAIASIPKQRSPKFKIIYLHFTTVPSEIKDWIKATKLL
ncbi:adenylate/guanylate cyclase domain-containing protein [Pseudanabaena sp. FACHB-1998]|uniref:CHASE2 domain-containing protein n=1 Tax=Pseudanabaena sp. FACHB-1998 TaxID=2692858 RepID=UPI001681A20B|nr:adenylate/guanylate cyclase domain-containing protein [Pseudanabaena sp. FACHB-1998]MBD2176955.1 adenylate/guanylate cyclase domain-containing protein [Pseudanabaena sp. FACHB-1998]